MRGAHVRWQTGTHAWAKNRALAEEGDELEETTAERNRNVWVIFTQHVSLLHPKRDSFPVKTF